MNKEYRQKNCCTDCTFAQLKREWLFCSDSTTLWPTINTSLFCMSIPHIPRVAVNYQMERIHKKSFPLFSNTIFFYWLKFHSVLKVVLTLTTCGLNVVIDLQYIWNIYIPWICAQTYSEPLILWSIIKRIYLLWKYYQKRLKPEL